MNILPKYWKIKNRYQEVRDYLANEYGLEEIKTWSSYEYIGYDGCAYHRGAHGAGISSFYNNAIEITIEQFRKCIRPTEPIPLIFN